MMPQDIAGIGMTSQRTRDRLVQRLRDAGICHEQVLQIIACTPRHLFVDEALASRAYEDSALPIGYGQTISRPYTVARMTEVLLAEGTPDKVLEIGTGSGYQTAVLSGLVAQVFTVERIEPLHRRARNLLRKLRVNNVSFKISDGSFGWESQGPFNAIIVTAAPEDIPESLKQQLAENGRLIIPVGGEQQQLVLIRRTADGFEQQVLESARFVPLVGGAVS